MASAQVLRKQEHLEAGKRRLEEFRKKKAADRAKKSLTTTQTIVTSDSVPDFEINIRAVNSDDAGVSYEPGGTSDWYRNDAITRNEPMNFNNAESNKPTTDYSNHVSEKSYGLEESSDSGILGRVASDYEMPTTSQSGVLQRSSFDKASQLHSNHNSERSIITQDSYDLEQLQKKQIGNAINDHALQASPSLATNSSSNLVKPLSESKSNYDSFPNNDVQYSWPVSTVRGSTDEYKKEIDQNKHSSNLLFSSFGKKKFGDTSFSFPRKDIAEEQNISSTTIGTLNQYDSYDDRSFYASTPESQVRRSRPSFLDSLNLGASTQNVDSLKASFASDKTKLDGIFDGVPPRIQNHDAENDVGSSSSLKSGSLLGNTFNVETHNGSESNLSNSTSDANKMPFDQRFYYAKRDDDFSALEQHIEDLTQEKFSLQKALEASQALAESLAAENSSMTDNYNQQRGVVYQLKSDMEKLQNEIKEHLLVLEAVKIEYSNAQLECNAADERAKLLASEVIGLEEKALRLRSNELKLERQLEDLQSEINSHKRKINNLEKDRQDMKMTIDALQEEKKLLQSKLRKGVSSGKSVDVCSVSINRKDVSTNTDDIGIVNNCAVDVANDDTKLTLSDNIPLHIEESSAYIPPDQMRVIQNIDALISELTLEKTDLMNALTKESSECAKLKELNKELSRKLESQTQRLELLAAQSMASGSSHVTFPEADANEEGNPYADEGDEVVERVLLWIMKLFPGGPAKRRTSKLL